MKKNIIITSIIILFTLFINLNFLLGNDNIGVNGFFLTIIGFFFYIILIIIQPFLLNDLKQDFNIKKGLFLSINSVCLILILIFPKGIYSPKEERKILLVAGNEGAANCRTILSLYQNKEFKEMDICFGKTTTKGTYNISNDTIFFKVISLGKNKKNFNEYVVIEKDRKTVYRQYRKDSLKRILNVFEININ